MQYAMVIFPEIDRAMVDALRRKYDPNFDLIAPHITLVFPFPIEVDEVRLGHHINNILRDRRPFKIILSGLKKSDDHYLFLLIEDGDQELIELHNRLYTGILTPYLITGMEYIPHLTLGCFTQCDAKGVFESGKELSFDSLNYREALKEAQEQNLYYECMVDRIHLLKIDLEKITIFRQFEI
jgi:2'-5' RNA ligase